ncbi:hypothetical protein CAEBREN_15740 [Caenorhabditis brenneri]|uniref:Phlebovirus glycoprotein G2 fusion domain-containing protein n=1 Tax=Caenorhabditis brenneri TaxID=135651 RepID=G0NSV4_CAEBE|nr:hypothetical protein CAEBREN_15740 [Caenorhabditis brenneri]
MVSEVSPTSPEPVVLETDVCIGQLQTSKITADTITTVRNVVAEDLCFLHTRIADVSDAASDWFEMVEERKATLEGYFNSPNCYSRSNAEQFNCVWGKDICNCIAKETSLKCGCSLLGLDDVISQNVFNEIDAKEGNLDIRYLDNKIVTKITSSGIIAFQLQLQNFTVSRVSHHDDCKTSYFTDLPGLIQCPSFSGHLKCNMTGRDNKINIIASLKSLDENC